MSVKILREHCYLHSYLNWHTSALALLTVSWHEPTLEKGRKR